MLTKGNDNESTKYLLEDCKGFIFGSISTKFWM